MIEISRVAVAVCDSSKFGKRSLSLIAPASALQHVITDAGIHKADLSALRKSGAEVTVV
jgi:DeoR family transcriptional regulator of aga operon